MDGCPHPQWLLWAQDLPFLWLCRLQLQCPCLQAFAPFWQICLLAAAGSARRHQGLGGLPLRSWHSSCLPV